MHDLYHLQNAFQQYLIAKDSEIQEQVTGTQRVPIEVRLSIYSDAYFLRLLEVLQKDFPGVAFLLGEDVFTEMAREYLKLFPSHFRSVRWFGQDLPTFLAKEKPYSSHEILFQMATFEWFLTESFDCENTLSLTLEKLQTIPALEWPMMRLSPCRSLRLISADWNIIQLWKAVTNAEEITPEKLPEKIQWIIWRKGYEVQFRSLSKIELIALNTLVNGESFETLCEAIYPYVNEDEAPLHAASLLKRWVLDELILDF